MKNRPRDVLYCGVDKNKILTAHPKFNTEYFSWFHDYIIERYTIHLKKDVYHYPKPWTTDPILLDYKFTNVFRELDTVSKQIINGIALNDDLTLEEKIYNIFLARTWNRYDTLVLMGGPFKMQDLEDIHALKERIRPLIKDYPENAYSFNSAFFTSGTKGALKYEDLYNHAFNVKGIKKWGIREHLNDSTGIVEPNMNLRPLHIINYMKEVDAVNHILNAKNQEECLDAIATIRSVKKEFTGYQYYVDCTYIPDFPFSENEVVCAGPGCRLGLDYLFTDKDGLTYEELLFWLRNNFENLCEMLEDYSKQYPELGLTQLKYDRLELFCDRPIDERYINVMAMQNCFCEYSKYWKIKKGIRSRRRRYNGRN